MTDLARTLVDAVANDGKAFSLEVSVGVPFLSEQFGFWVCKLTMQPLMSKPVDIARADSLQALCLALAMARGALADFTAKGGRLLIEGEPFPIDAYFGVWQQATGTEPTEV